MRRRPRSVSEGEGGDALAFVIAAAFAGVVLLPATALLDLKLAAGRFTAALACLAVAAVLGRGRALRAPAPAVLALLAALWAARGLSALASPYRGLGLADGGLLAASALLVALLLGPWARIEGALGAWRWSTLAVAGYALAQRLGLEPLAAYAQAGSRVRAMGSFGNAGYLAAFLALSWPLLLAWTGARRAVAVGLAWLALLATQSRAGLLALGFQGLLGGVAAWRRGWRPSRGSLVAAALGTGLGAFLFQPSAWLRPTLRWPLWRASWDLWWQRPWLGWGPGTFAVAFQDHGPPALVGVVNAGNQYAEDPHQWLLALACATGLLGLGVTLAAAVAAGAAARRTRAPGLRPAAWLGLVGLLVESQFDRFLAAPGLLLPLAVLLAALAWREGPPLAPALRRRPLALVPLGLGLLLALAGLRPLLAYAHAVGTDLGGGARAIAPAVPLARLRAAAVGRDPQAYDRLGAALAARGRYADAATAYRQALRLGPSAGRAQNLGNCFMMLGDPKAAEGAFRLATGLDPGSSDAHFSLGYALFYQKRLTAAVVELDRALALDPHNASAAKLKEEILP